jgi:hypothetical protein
LNRPRAAGRGLAIGPACQPGTGGPTAGDVRVGRPARAYRACPAQSRAGRRRLGLSFKLPSVTSGNPPLCTRRHTVHCGTRSTECTALRVHSVQCAHRTKRPFRNVLSVFLVKTLDKFKARSEAMREFRKLSSVPELRQFTTGKHRVHTVSTVCTVPISILLSRFGKSARTGRQAQTALQPPAVLARAMGRSP